jgi:hypothetical protein
MKRLTVFSKLVISALIIMSAFMVSKVFISIGGFSEGERIGELVKFSNKGFLCKTWEGTLQTGDTAGTQFNFTVTDPSVIDSLSTMGGHKIKVVYKQNYMTGVCQGDTDYFVVNVFRI